MSTEYFEEEDDRKQGNAVVKKSNVLPLWGNERTMNLNPLILTNIQSSHYFKVNLYELKTYHEVIDEIYYKVAHLEPWEKGSRKTSGQTGMCGGVRGVGAGGIVSTAYCLLYKLFTLKLTRKQLNGLITHPDSPYIRALGFMYIRYTQPPADLWDWYDEYLEDTEEMDVKAGGGQVMTIGNILKSFLSKLEWFSTLFPRIPVPIQQKLEKNLAMKFANQKPAVPKARTEYVPEEKIRHRSRSRERDSRRDYDRDTRRDVDRDHRETRRDVDRDRRDPERDYDGRRDDRDRKDLDRDRRDLDRDQRRDDRHRSSNSDSARHRERERGHGSSRQREDRARPRDTSRERCRHRSKSRNRHHRY